MRGTIKAKMTVAKQTGYVEFDLGEAKVEFKPGQYFFVTLNPSDETNREDLTHHFSIVNSPNQQGILALATRMRVERSLFKRTLDQAKIGDEVEIGKIGGSFVLPDNTDSPLVFIALGIGITPFISMLRYVLEENVAYQTTLFYSDGEVESMPFLEELKQMAEAKPNFKLVTIVTQDKKWQGENGRIDASMLQEYLGNLSGKIYFVSGPPRPVEELSSTLMTAGVSEENVKKDSFSGY